MAGGKADAKGKPKGGKPKGKTDVKGKSTTTTSTDGGKTGVSVAAMSAEGETHGGGGQQNPPAQQHMEAQGKESQASGQGDAGAIVSEVATLLKSLRLSGEAQLRVCQVRKIAEAGEDAVLIDGGATHCLKMATAEEWARGHEITVQLAAGSIQLRQDPVTNFLLTKEKVQPIIAVSRLAEAGYVLRWDQAGCKIDGGKRGVLPVKMVQGCPTVHGECGRKLLEELAKEGHRRAAIRAVIACGTLAESQEEKEIAELKALFPQVPEKLLEELPGERQWEGDRLPFNRRRRRQIEQAEKVIIHAFSGPEQARWKQMERNGVVVVCLDILNGSNLRNSHLAGWLDDQFRRGKVDMLLAGPPCRTVSLCRHRDDGGPRPLRARDGPERFGKENLTDWEKETVDNDSILWLKCLRWARMMLRTNPRSRLVLEQPQDPEEWKERVPDQDPFPSFMAWEETQAMMRDLNMKMVRMHQGALGHDTMKPTMVVTNAQYVMALDGLRMKNEGERWPEGVEERMNFSKGLARWAPGLVSAIQQEIKVMISENSPKARALKAKEKEEAELWRRHCVANHTPYRRDCAVCVETAGKDRPRYRVKCPESFCLSLDVAGPFIEGHDQELRAPRYFLVGTVTIPVQEGAPLVQGLQELPRSNINPEAEQDDLEDLEGEELRELEEEKGEELLEEEQALAKEREDQWRAFLGDAKAH